MSPNLHELNISMSVSMNSSVINTSGCFVTEALFGIVHHFTCHIIHCTFVQ